MRVSSHLNREQKSRLKPKGLEYKKLFNETTKVCQKAISIKQALNYSVDSKKTSVRYGIVKLISFTASQMKTCIETINHLDKIQILKNGCVEYLNL